MAMDQFLKILPGVDGESHDKTHAKDIDVLAWSWGASNSGSAHIGGGAGAGKANFQDISVTKYVDSSTPLLLHAVASGKHFDKATLTVRKAGDTPLEYLIIDVYEVLISSLSTGGSGGEDRLTENVSLNFSKFELKYVPQSDKGTPGTAIPASWDIRQNVK